MSLFKSVCSLTVSVSKLVVQEVVVATSGVSSNVRGKVVRLEGKVIDLTEKVDSKIVSK